MRYLKTCSAVWNVQCSAKMPFISDPCIDDINDDVNLQWTLSSLQIHWALDNLKPV